MSPVKESLHRTIDRLSDEQARQILDYVRLLSQRVIGSLTFKRLADNPTFRVPPAIAFRAIKPIHGQGVLASMLLVEARR